MRVLCCFTYCPIHIVSVNEIIFKLSGRRGSLITIEKLVGGIKLREKKKSACDEIIVLTVYSFVYTPVSSGFSADVFHTSCHSIQRGQYNLKIHS